MALLQVQAELPGQACDRHRLAPAQTTACLQTALDKAGSNSSQA